MKRFAISGLSLAAVVAIGAIWASAALATPTEFEYSTGGDNYSGRALTTQEFKLGNAIVECDEVHSEGEMTKLNFKEISLTTKYSECDLLFVGQATIGAVHSTWSLPPSVRLENQVEIAASFLGTTCRIALTANQSLGQKSGEIEYKNDGKGIIIDSHITGIAYEVIESNSPQHCGTQGEKGTTGEFEGEELILYDYGYAILKVN